MENPRIWFDGKLVNHEDATVHVLSHVLHYGSSVFEGIRCYKTDKGSAVFRLREHMRRLVDSAKIHRMEIDYDLDTLCDAVVETIEDSGLDACYIRPLTFRGHGKMGVNPLNNPVRTIIAVWEWGQYLGPEALENGVDVQVASWSRPAPNTIPAMAKAGGNYIGSSLIKMDAIKNGFAEGIALTVDGYLSEGSGENLFIIRDGVIHTPPAAFSILPGITRDSIITIARERGYEVREVAMPREALYIADEVFFTGTAAEVTPVRSVDHHVVGGGTRGPITTELQTALFDVLHRGEDSHGWLRFVGDAAPEASGDGVASGTKSPEVNVA
ncbi:branched-chain amino acid transaminase [Rubricoccus marinus]|uniref:Branched-chain-amino-acid aminotransferase n=1 Tax=Rubricoccus marinus TaxID=716817 RepID=A0A259U2H9_9BACT|nr:branched-chain amino acid transaminase [Rubricoccus marinus]OZC04199.1 branched chain amino acid aminotransferase [Rubricoccus marinus]